MIGQIGKTPASAPKLSNAEIEVANTVYSVLENIKSFDSKKLADLDTLIKNLKTGNMKDAANAGVALEVLQPIYALKFLDVYESSQKEKKPEYADLRTEVENFFKNKSMQIPASLSDEVLKKLEIVGQANSQKLREVLLNYKIQSDTSKPALANTCYLHAALNIVFRNQAVWNQITTLTPESEDGKEIKKLLLNLSESYKRASNSDIENDDNFLKLIEQYSQLLTKSNKRTADSTSRQQDAGEMLSLMLKKLGVSVGDETVQEVSDKNLVYIQQDSSEDITAFADVTDDGLKIAAIVIHTGETKSSENGVSATSGHYRSLVKTGNETWQLYDYQQPVKAFTADSYENLLQQIRNSQEFKGATFRGIYTTQSS